MRMRTHAMAGVAAAAMLTLSACGGGDAPTIGTGPGTSGNGGLPTSATSTAPSSPASPTASSPTSSSPTSSSPTSEPRTFAAGDCLESSRDPKKVDCSQPHKLEVTAVVPNSEHTGDLVKRASLRNYTCQGEAPKYTGGPAFGTILISDQVGTSADPKSGEQFVCLVAKTTADDSGYESVQGSLKGIVTKEGLAKYAFCTTDKASGDPGKIIPCTQPHVSESFGGFQNTPFGPYPGEDKMKKTALDKCRQMGKDFLGSTRGDIVISQNSSGPNPWAKGTQLTACFVQTDGTKVTKTMKGIGNKPLSSLK
ncbi:putative regulator of septum formation [Yimella lutea]|uniref:Putative regulator of septum formation n=1 Tax=Yimella lutea TaxID=587872 RepID=A0A542EF70_9MICO|nr:putative regulator of septum formation [Yimella lutea]